MAGTESTEEIQGRDKKDQKKDGSPQTTVAAGLNDSAGSSAQQIDAALAPMSSLDSAVRDMSAADLKQPVSSVPNSFITNSHELLT